MSRSDFVPTASWEAFRRRATLLRETREFFHERAFLECETPLLSRDSVIDLHLDPLSVTLFHDAREPEQGPRYWLQTSPEFGMKRLLAAGSPSLYQISKAFRGGERGAMHNPEFTIVEWYGVGDDYQAGVDTLEALVMRLLKTASAERISYREAFLRYARIDPFTATKIELADAARSAGLASSCNDRDGLLEFLMSMLVEPRLGKERPAIVYDYPASQAALARVRAEEHPVAERFELYYRGVELANGYHELQDAGTLRERNRMANEQRSQDGKYRLSEESRLIDALESGLPACAGCALGFDRLVMLALEVSDISEVLAFPIERA